MFFPTAGLGSPANTLLLGFWLLSSPLPSHPWVSKDWVLGVEVLVTCTYTSEGETPRPPASHPAKHTPFTTEVRNSQAEETELGPVVKGAKGTDLWRPYDPR